MEGVNQVYKKYASLILLIHCVLLVAWLCIQGITIDKTAARAFVLLQKEGEAVQATSFLGVMKEQISEQRTLQLQTITRKNRIEITTGEYENLLRIVEAEAGGEDKMGKMLVANVIINRVEDDRFPDTINQVIFQEEEGVAQFSPIADGRFYQVKITQETIEAVNDVLSGEDNSKGALYFAARKAADPENMKWFDENLTRLFAYGSHEFFL
ncbi:MAG: cell wall hydrolase [Lachnospiraceae bacterium]|nr:cell wall hydrolase [Lachnospiraceae bacterium]